MNIISFEVRGKYPPRGYCVRRYPHCGLCPQRLTTGIEQDANTKASGSLTIANAHSQFHHLPTCSRGIVPTTQIQKSAWNDLRMRSGIPPNRIPKSKAKPSATARRPFRSQLRSAVWQSQPHALKNDHPTPCSPVDRSPWLGVEGTNLIKSKS